MKAIHNYVDPNGKETAVVVYTKGTEYESNSQHVCRQILYPVVVVYTKGTEYESNSQPIVFFSLIHCVVVYTKGTEYESNSQLQII